MAMRLFLINSFPPPQQLFLCLPFFYLPPNPPAPYSALASISFYSSIMQSLRGLCTGCSLCQKNSSLDTHMLIPLHSSNLYPNMPLSVRPTLVTLLKNCSNPVITWPARLLCNLRVAFPADEEVSCVLWASPTHSPASPLPLLFFSIAHSPPFRRLQNFLYLFCSLSGFFPPVT